MRKASELAIEHSKAAEEYQQLKPTWKQLGTTTPLPSVKQDNLVGQRDALLQSVRQEAISALFLSGSVTLIMAPGAEDTTSRNPPRTAIRSRNPVSPTPVERPLSTS